MCVDPNTLIVAYDVTNLYSNIPHELGKQAISFCIDKYPDTLHDLLKTLSKSIEIILNNNSLQFNKGNYIQTLGKDIGTRTVPTYATYLEENLCEVIGKKIRQQHKRRIYKIMEKIFRWLFYILEMPLWRH